MLGGVITLLVAGSEFAFWTAGVSGTGSATVSGGSSALIANQSTVLTAMFPGGATQTISGTFNNSNAGPVHLTSVTAGIASVVKAGNAPSGTSDATDFELAFDVMSVDAQVPLDGCIRAAPTYHLSLEQARAIVDHQIDVIRNTWREVCEQASMTQAERRLFAGRAVFNPYAFYGYLPAAPQF